MMYNEHKLSGISFEYIHMYNGNNNAQTYKNKYAHVCFLEVLWHQTTFLWFPELLDGIFV